MDYIYSIQFSNNIYQPHKSQKSLNYSQWFYGDTDVASTGATVLTC